nr:hypothetical protein [uncultured Methanoregula sp.]
MAIMVRRPVFPGTVSRAGDSEGFPQERLLRTLSGNKKTLIIFIGG